MQNHVVIAGGTGLIGRALTLYLRAQGYDVYVLTRSPRERNHIAWEPKYSRCADYGILENSTALINLCGQSIADKCWTSKYKKTLESSRIKPTDYLADLIYQTANPPQVYIGASGIGIYGNSGAGPVNENYTAADSRSFIVKLSKRWEQAHEEVIANPQRKVSEHNQRPVPHTLRGAILRIAPVLTPTGGFFEKMKLPTKMLMYPIFGSGHQYMGWVHIDDMCKMILFIIKNPEISGAINATSPGAVTNSQFMRALKSTTKKSGIFFHVPEGLLRLAMGEASALLFDSCFAVPKKLNDAGFQFNFPEIEPALRNLIK